MVQEKDDLRVRRPATAVMIKLNRFQRDTLLSIGTNIEDLINDAINKYLDGKWLIKCQACDYKWEISDLKEMHNPGLMCSQCKSVQFWQHIPEAVINEKAYSDKPHFKI